MLSYNWQFDQSGKNLYCININKKRKNFNIICGTVMQDKIYVKSNVSAKVSKIKTLFMQKIMVLLTHKFTLM